jgi:hypothetical protein
MASSTANDLQLNWTIPLSKSSELKADALASASFMAY